KEIQDFNDGRPPGSQVGVVMVSAHTKRGADVTVRALQAGAFDFVTKPSGESAAESVALLRQQLLCKIRQFLASRGHVPPPAPAPPARGRQRWLHAGGPVRAVLVATSTGGPRALEALLPEMCRRVEVPVFVVQHMPAGFTQSLADQLDLKVSGRVV